MGRVLGMLAAALLLSCVARAGEVERHLGVSCQVVPSATFRTTLVTATQGGGARVVVASRGPERGPAAGWLVSRAGAAVLDGPGSEGDPAQAQVQAPAGAGALVVTIFPDGAPERVIFLAAPDRALRAEVARDE